MDKELETGAFAIPYLGHAFKTQDSVRSQSIQTPLVIKVAKIDTAKYPTDDTRHRIAYIERKNDEEIKYLRPLLHKCKHVNLIFDHGTDDRSDFRLPFTVQLFLNDAWSLNKWLSLTLPASKHSIAPSKKEWCGITNNADWLSTALLVAEALKEIHRRRVTHGDIHPGNIFMQKKEPYYARLIDFGEAFVATPDFNHRPRNPRSYLAPERFVGPQIPLNELVDVYSFGILLIYLATGIDPQLPHTSQRRKHREDVTQVLQGECPALVNQCPLVVDLISRCTSRDPVDRPRMIEIFDDLHRFSRFIDGVTLTPIRTSPQKKLNALAQKMSRVIAQQGPVLAKLLERKIDELDYIFSGLGTEMVELFGTRDQMLRVMISLLEMLQMGDSWTSATTLPVWQGNALGLNGSYASANIMAIKRGVAIRRTFMISVDELGLGFCQELAKDLVKSGRESLEHLGHLFEKAISAYPNSLIAINASKSREHTARTNDGEFLRWSGLQFQAIIDTLLALIKANELLAAGLVNSDKTIDLAMSKGLYLGICPVATMDDIGSLREANPVSLMHFPSEPVLKRRWRLVNTEVRGRIDVLRDSDRAFEAPQLVGVRVYQSIRGEPKDRVLYLTELMNERSANVGLDVEMLSEAVTRVRKG